MRLSKLKSYMKRARVVAEDSHDEQTQVGALLVNRDTGAVIASGFNGFVRGAVDDALPRTRPEKYPYMIHAEENLLMNSARHGISTENCDIVVTLSPCVHCLRLLYQAGIKSVYFEDEYTDFHRNLNMKDLNVDVFKEEGFTRLVVSPRKYD